ncbi:MAG: PLP-dependent aspartate aminotransferase family protein [Vicinamibacteria bacterium]
MHDPARRRGVNGHRFETRAAHAGREGLRALGVHAPPIDLSSTYPLEDLAQATQSVDSMAKGGEPVGSPIYARMHNPTVARFEEALAELEGAEASVAFGSGMAAFAAALLAARLARPDAGAGHVVAVRPLYGGSDHLLASGLLGLEASFVSPDGVKSAIRPDTVLVVAETPGNPTLDLVDLDDLVRQAGTLPVLIDSTFATPVLQRPLRHGVSLVLHSATKFLGGHGDVIAGAVAASQAWVARLRQVRIATGALLHPLAAYLLHRSLPTLPLRVRAAQAGARLIAERLAGHPAVSHVLYPGFGGSDPRGLVGPGRQMEGPGSVLSFEIVGGLEAASRVMKAVRLTTPAVSLGSADTLLQHPAGLTHRIVAEDARERTGISPSLLRLSVGIEDPEDIWADLEQALAQAGTHANAKAMAEIVSV